MKTNTITIVIVTLALAAGAYWFFSTGSGSQSALTASASNNPSEVRFQALMNQLQLISFDASIFSDPKFASLVDIATPLVPEASGRLDPFSPVPGVTGM